MKHFKIHQLQYAFGQFKSGKTLNLNKCKCGVIFIFALYSFFPVRNVCADVKLNYANSAVSDSGRQDVNHFATFPAVVIDAIPANYRKAITNNQEDYKTCKWDDIYKDINNCTTCGGTRFVTIQNEWELRYPIRCPVYTYNGVGSRHVTLTTCTPDAHYDNSTYKCVAGRDPKPEGKNFGNPPFCLICLLKGNPINIGTGNKFQIETDYRSPVQGGLQFRHYYNSFNEDPETADVYGNGWSADYGQRIIPISATEVNVRRPDGKRLRFLLVNGAWSPDADVVLQLQEVTNGQGQRTGWLLTLEDDTVEEYAIDSNSTGRLITITKRNGQASTLEYSLSTVEGGDDNPATLDRVTGTYGRSLAFHYDSNNYLAGVIDPAGDETRYTYDANGNLAAVIFPDDTPSDPNDNPSRIYHYENPVFAHALTGITDENGNRYATWNYDSKGRAKSSEHAGGAGRVIISYNSDATVTVTEAGGATSTYTFTTIQGVVKPVQITGDPCSDCGTVQSVTYDANGYPASATDFNGNVTTYVYNSRGLETSRTEAVGTAMERTITTTWDPTFRLPLTITEPGKVTSFTYDDRGNLLKRKEEVAQ